MRPPHDRHNERPEDVEEEIDPEELEELNRSTSSTSFFDKPWWRWGAIAIAALVIASFALPAIQPLLGGGNDTIDRGEGLHAPDFTLESPNRGNVTLSEELAQNDHVIVLFYRTYY